MGKSIVVEIQNDILTDVNNFSFIIATKYIKSDKIEFDAVSTCTLATPCNFSSPESWLGGDLPGENDDVVIDYSHSNTHEVYIFAKGLSGSYRSLTIKGHTTSDDKSHPHLILTDCNINISRSFSIVRANVIFNQTSTKINNNIDIYNNLKLINNSALYVYNNNIVNAMYMNVDIKSKIHFYNNSLLQVNGNSTFENTPMFMDQSVFIAFNEKEEQQHLSLFKNGLYSVSGQVTLGKSEFSGGSPTVLNNLILNDLIKVTNGANLTINNKFNMISSGGILIDSSNSKLIISSKTLKNQQLSNVELSNGGQIIINNPTIQVNKITGTGDIQFDSNRFDEGINVINELKSNSINIGIAGNSNVFIKSSTINKLYDFESKLNSSNTNSNAIITGTVNIGRFNLINTKITIESQNDILIISNLNDNHNEIYESIINQGELHLINSNIKSSVDSSGTVVLNNSTLNGYLYLFGSGELNYTLASNINSFLQLDDNSKAIINYNNIHDKLTLNGNLIINSDFFSIISNNENNNNDNSVLVINGNIYSTVNKSPSVSLYFTSQPLLNQPYQLFKLPSESSSNKNQTLSSLLSSIIQPILITDTNHHNINTKLNLKSQYYYDNNSIAYTRFNLPPIVKHMSGWEIFLIIFSCIAVVVLVAGMIFAYSNHKRYFGYLPL